jgi:hypothetical protein
MRPGSVTLQSTISPRLTLGPGDIIGRMWSAALFLDDPRVSEAHAMIGLRGDRLEMLALRGALTLDGMPASRVRLARDQRIHLVHGLWLDVIDVELPETALVLRGLDDDHVLRAPVYSLAAGGALVPSFEPDALAWLWSTEDGWRFRTGTEPAEELDPGWTRVIGGRALRLAEIPRSGAQTADTILPSAHALHLVARYDTVHIHVKGGPSLVLTGLMARMMSELATIARPVGWEVVAGALWPREADRMQLRLQWDKTVHKLRSRLRAANLRQDIIRPDGHGNYELFLLPGDTVEDQT